MEKTNSSQMFNFSVKDFKRKAAAFSKESEATKTTKVSPTRSKQLNNDLDWQLSSEKKFLSPELDDTRNPILLGSENLENVLHGHITQHTDRLKNKITE